MAEIPTRLRPRGPAPGRGRDARGDALRASTWSTRRTFFDGAWGGQADFLLRADQPSDLGDWSYDIADTKLARRLKVPALLQMATYAERLTVLQGVAPELLTVVTGDGVERPWRLVDVASYARRARARLQQAFVAGRRPPSPAPVAALRAVPLGRPLHQPSWRAGRRPLASSPACAGDHRHALIAAGLPTARGAGRRRAGASCRRTDRRDRRASGCTSRRAEQLSERTTGQPPTTLLPPEPDRGLLRLPPPSDGDLYLDFEGDPFAATAQGREYLAGLWDRAGASPPVGARPRRRRRQLAAT